MTKQMFIFTLNCKSNLYCLHGILMVCNSSVVDGVRVFCKSHRVYNDILLALDKGQVSILVLLDFSAIFDKINHDVFFKRFSHKYGL